MDVGMGAAICGAALLLACSSAAMAESGLASVYAYSGGKTASGERANPRRTYRRTSHAEIWHARARDQSAQRAQRHRADQ